MPTAHAFKTRRLSGDIWRAVETQYETSTRKIVDTAEEQEELEFWLDQSKPSYPPGTEKLNYLLKTPFRYYPPNPQGSRFRRPGDRNGVFYASEHIRTALVEIAYYRLRFFKASPGTPFPRNQEQLTLFKTAYKTSMGIDLTREPYVKQRKKWVHGSNYDATQKLADRASINNIEVIRYESVRDIEKSANIALLIPGAFVVNKPKSQQTWFLYISEKEINCTRALVKKSEDVWAFPRKHFGI